MYILVSIKVHSLPPTTRVMQTCSDVSLHIHMSSMEGKRISVRIYCVLNCNHTSDIVYLQVYESTPAIYVLM